jgi:hypothetical protein
MRLPIRRTLWLSTTVLLVVMASAWFFVPRSRVTKANFDRIRDGMSLEEVNAILGVPDESSSMFTSDTVILYIGWENGPNWLFATIENGAVRGKEIHLAAAWETLSWYAKKGAKKIGVNWDD